MQVDSNRSLRLTVTQQMDLFGSGAKPKPNQNLNNRFLLPFVLLTMRCVDVAEGGQGVSSVMVPVGMKINDSVRPVSPV